MFHKSTHSVSDAIAAAMAATFGVAIYEKQTVDNMPQWKLSIIVPKAQYTDDEGWIAAVMDNGDLLVPADSLSAIAETLLDGTKPELSEKEKFKAALTGLLTRIAEASVGKKHTPKVSGIVMMSENGEAIAKGAAINTITAAVDWVSLAEDAHAMLHDYESRDTRVRIAEFLSGLAMAAVVDELVPANDVLPHLACFAEDEGDGKMSISVGVKQ